MSTPKTYTLTLTAEQLESLSIALESERLTEDAYLEDLQDIAEMVHTAQNG
jgi:hypothetical protein